MVTLESIKIEYKAGAVLGGIALVLSVVIGLAAGNTIVYSLGRAVFLGIVFALLGAGLTVLLKKYVPELFEITLTAEIPAEAPVAAPDTEDRGSSFSAGMTSSEGSAFDAPAEASGGTGEQGFVPLGDYVTGQQQYGDEHLQTRGSGKIGKHYLEEKGMKFEPKILAEAIRTMMSKE